MAVRSTAEQECWQLVQDYLLVSELRYEIRDDGNGLELHFTDAPRVVVWTFLAADRPFVGLRCYLVSGAQTSEDLHLRLLRKNFDLVLGKLCVDPDGDILIEHVLGGSDLDRGELLDALEAVALAGKEVRAEILAGYGGRALP